MIVKIHKSKDLAATMRYAYQDYKQGEVVASTCLSVDREGATQEMALAIAMREDSVKRPFMHVSLSLDKGEALSGEQWESVTHAYMKEMGFEHAPYVAIKHHDTEHEHIHIVASRIDWSQDLVSDSMDYRRSEVLARAFEREHALRELPCSWEQEGRAPKQEEYHQSRRLEQPSARQTIREALDQALLSNPTSEELLRRLEAQGVSVYGRFEQGEAKLLGVGFEHQGVHIPASKLGQDVRLEALEKQLAGAGLSEVLVAAKTLKPEAERVLVRVPEVYPVRPVSQDEVTRPRVTAAPTSSKSTQTMPLPELETPRVAPQKAPVNPPVPEVYPVRPVDVGLGKVVQERAQERAQVSAALISKTTPTPSAPVSELAPNSPESTSRPTQTQARAGKKPSPEVCLCERRQPLSEHPILRTFDAPQGASVELLAPKQNGQLYTMEQVKAMAADTWFGSEGVRGKGTLLSKDVILAEGRHSIVVDEHHRAVLVPYREAFEAHRQQDVRLAHGELTPLVVRPAQAPRPQVVEKTEPTLTPPRRSVHPIQAPHPVASTPQPKLEAPSPSAAPGPQGGQPRALDEVVSSTTATHAPAQTPIQNAATRVQLDVPSVPVPVSREAAPAAQPGAGFEQRPAVPVLACEQHAPLKRVDLLALKALNREAFAPGQPGKPWSAAHFMESQTKGGFETAWIGSNLDKLPEQLSVMGRALSLKEGQAVLVVTPEHKVYLTPLTPQLAQAQGQDISRQALIDSLPREIFRPAVAPRVEEARQPVVKSEQRPPLERDRLKPIAQNPTLKHFVSDKPNPPALYFMEAQDKLRPLDHFIQERAAKGEHWQLATEKNKPERATMMERDLVTAQGRFSVVVTKEHEVYLLKNLPAHDKFRGQDVCFRVNGVDLRMAYAPELKVSVPPPSADHRLPGELAKPNFQQWKEAIKRDDNLDARLVYPGDKVKAFITNYNAELKEGKFVVAQDQHAKLHLIPHQKELEAFRGKHVELEMRKDRSVEVKDLTLQNQRDRGRDR